MGKSDDTERQKGGRSGEWTLVSRDAASSDVPVIIDIAARFSFRSKSQADTAAGWIRVRYDGSARLWRATRSGEWFIDGRIPRTRFDLERIRLLTQELADLAEAHDGVLVDWHAIRPRRGVQERFRLWHRIRRRTAMIVGVDVVVAVTGLMLPAEALVFAAVIAGAIEGVIWLLVRRPSPRQ